MFEGFEEESGACRLQGRIWCFKASRKALVLEGEKLQQHWQLVLEAPSNSGLPDYSNTEYKGWLQLYYNITLNIF